MLKRKVDAELKNWKEKDRKDRKCLIVQGPRQTGKTYSIRQFGKNNYQEVLEINFKKTPSAKEIFSGDLNVDSMIMAMRFRFPRLRIVPENTLIFLDEIQECPEAVTSLKFWTDDGHYDVIASGSLLGIDYNRPSSYPVGYVEYMNMHGLDFEEFLWNAGINEYMISSLHDCMRKRTPVPASVNEQMMKYLRIYASLGGMPEVLQNYADHHDFRIADEIQRDILQGYLYDIAHYALPDEKLKAEKCYLSLSKQLLDKENHKFQYKEVEKGGRAQKYYSSIEWLLRADMIQLCRRVSDIHFDLDDYADDGFYRAYPTDLSLLDAMKDFSLKQHIVENTLSGSTKGGFYECLIADMLYKKGYKLYFYKNETTKMEIDFLIQKEGNAVPIEVKSGNKTASSLNSLMRQREDIQVAYKLVDGNIGTGEDGRILTIPLYMAMFL